MKTLSFIVPYRDRAAHLTHFIKHMRARFRQEEILIVEQGHGKPFNRAKLLNIGFLNSNADFFAFHDVDMLPFKADYSFPVNPTHIATKCSQFRYKMPFKDYFGGVTLFNREDFVKANGYSNNFFSWGAEDCEMREHILKLGMKIDRRQCTFECLHHKPEDRSLYEKNAELLKKGRQPGDGLTHCEYEIIKKHNHGDYIKISVRI